jgi:hypothetical protein
MTSAMSSTIRIRLTSPLRISAISRTSNSTRLPVGARPGGSSGPGMGARCEPVEADSGGVWMEERSVHQFERQIGKTLPHVCVKRAYLGASMHGCRCGTVFDKDVLGHQRDEAVGVVGVESCHRTCNEVADKDLVDRCRFGVTSCHLHPQAFAMGIRRPAMPLDLSRTGNAWHYPKSWKLLLWRPSRRHRRQRGVATSSRISALSDAQLAPR